MPLKTNLKSCDNSHSIIEAIVQAETPKAILIHTCDEDDCWLPKSQIEVVDAFPVDSEKVIIVHVPNWLVTKNNIV